MQISGELSSRARRLWDVLVGSDPGLTRLRTAASAAFAMATALGVELGLSRLRGADPQGTLVAMLLGAVVAMMGSMALTGTGVWPKVRTGAGFPVAIGLGMVAGIAASPHARVMLVGFVAVMFAAVFVRRFGLPFFFYGFMLWMGYFFASFLHATWAMLPWLLVDTVVAAAWVVLLATTIARTHPGRTLWRVRRSFGARARRLASVLTALLDTDADERSQTRRRRRLHSLQAQLAEAALIIEAWSAEDGALPEQWSPQALRRRVLDAQLALDGIAWGGEALVTAPSEVRRHAATLTRALSLQHHDLVGGLADELDRRAAAADGLDAPAREGAAVLAESARDWVAIVKGVATPPTVAVDDFDPSVSLMMGNLPGSVVVAREVEARGGSWNPLRRLDFTTRQAVQVAVAGALAILLGKWLDETRYYWAVIAAFIAFTGTGSRAETFLKASNRVLGTLVGLVAGIELAHATDGHSTWILVTIVLSMFCGFYLVRINYAYMIFFVTIMVAQLYTVLHQFSDRLLVLRLEETVLGAVAGIAVGLLVTPVSTRDTVAQAQRGLLGSVAALLETLAGRPGEDEDAVTDPEALLRECENQLRQLGLVAAPLTRPLLLANDPAVVRHRLVLHARIVQTVRALVAQSRTGTSPLSEPALEGLAFRLRSLAEHPPGLTLRPVEEPAATALEGPAPLHARSISRLHRLLTQLEPAGSGPGAESGVRPEDVQVAASA
ncbi:MAG: FUSC family protein [Marmoricola sp.]